MSEGPHHAFAAELSRWASQRLGLARLQLCPDQIGRLRAAVRAQRMAADDWQLPGALGGGYLAWEVLVAAVTVRETYFFRHPEQLELLRTTVLPELCQSSPPGSLLRVWSAGCASGEEPYSLAMLFEEQGLLERVHVLGSDVCPASIETARRASYRAWSLRALSCERLSRHFEPAQRCQRVNRRLRRRVSFQVLNLVDAAYPSAASGTAGLSLICCRNVLMFLLPEVAHAVAERLLEALRPGGYLLTGPSDPLVSRRLACQVLVTKAGLLYRKAAAVSSVAPALPSTPQAGAVRSDSVARPVLRLPSVTLNTLAERPADAVRRACNAQGAQSGLAVCLAALELAPSDLELQYLRGLMLWELRRYAEAVSALRGVLYLDAKLALAHFGLAVLYESTGEPLAARRCYRNALACCAGVPPEAALPLGDGICAAGLQAAAEQGLSRLHAYREIA